MSREIKFKAKRKDNNEWVYGYYSKTDLGTFINQYRVDYENECTYCENFEVIPETVSQYTESDDMNGVEIYENDILKMFQIDYGSESENGYGESIFEYKEVHIEATLDFIYSYELYGEFLDDIEVIGNKSDNPELLDKDVK